MTTKTVTDSNAAVIENRSQLIDSFARGEKPKERWRIGTEHEKFVYAKSDLHAPSYDEPGGIRDLLTGLTEFGWQPVEEAGKIIALTGPDGAISLEPAGQFEIGRASGRERVCQYGSISVVAVSLKKKKKRRKNRDVEKVNISNKQ